MVADRASLLLGSCAWLVALALAGCGGGNSGERGGGGSTSTSGGSTGSGGATATGGGGGAPTKGYACDDPKAPDTAAMTFTADGKWGDTGFSGGTFTYGDGPDADTAADVTLSYPGGGVNVKGNVATYSGFGLWFGGIGGQKVPCVDANSYEGVSFHVVDNAGTSSTLQFSVQTHDTAPVDVRNTRGNCVYSDESKKYSECVYPSAMVTVPASGGVVELPWSAFTGGKPVADIKDGQALLDGLQWQFPWPSGATPYDADITITDLKFY